MFKTINSNSAFSLKALATGVLGVVLGFGNIVANAADEQWECALNLHQGDSGTLSLERSGDDVSGLLSVSRNDSVFKNDVSGSWTANEINLKRLLDANSSDAMVGVVVTTGTKTAKMGGRYSAEFQGVWSADCDLVSSVAEQSSSTAEGEASSTEPSTSSRITPSNPTNKDRVKFSARATHPDGIESISFFVDNKKIHSCDASACEFKYGPLLKGNRQWHVEALSKSGIKNSKRANDLIVKVGRTTGNCVISGSALGTSAELSSIYLVNLYGPNNNGALRASKEFQNKGYSFTNLPEGNYLVTVDTRADRGVLVTPSSSAAKCQSKGNVTVDFDFR